MDSAIAMGIRQQYQTIRPRYERLKDEVVTVLRAETHQSPRPIKITGRAKDPDSVQGKVLRKGYQSIDQFDDLAGVRAICKTRLEIDLVERAIADCFDVVKHEDKSV